MTRALFFAFGFAACIALLGLWAWAVATFF